jgi:hypothetical protein
MPSQQKVPDWPFPHKPLVVDLDEDIKEVSEYPICDFCSSDEGKVVFDTHRELFEHRMAVHEHKRHGTIGEEPEPIEVHLFSNVTNFTTAGVAEIHSWFDTVEQYLNTPPKERTPYLWTMAQKNLRPSEN